MPGFPTEISIDLLHKSNRPPLIPPCKGGKLEILLPPLYKGRVGEGSFKDFCKRSNEPASTNPLIITSLIDLSYPF